MDSSRQERGLSFRFNPFRDWCRDVARFCGRKNIHLPSLSPLGVHSDSSRRVREVHNRLTKISAAVYRPIGIEPYGLMGGVDHGFRWSRLRPQRRLRKPPVSGALSPNVPAIGIGDRRSDLVGNRRWGCWFGLWHRWPFANALQFPDYPATVPDGFRLPPSVAGSRALSPQKRQRCARWVGCL